jgi:hypothetical protein
MIIETNGMKIDFYRPEPKNSYPGAINSVCVIDWRRFAAWARQELDMNGRVGDLAEQIYISTLWETIAN